MNKRIIAIALGLMLSGALLVPALAAPSKDVNVVNVPTVNVVNVPAVEVVNVPTVEVATDDRIPYQISVSEQDWSTNSVNLIVDVPAGNRLVIEHVSASAFMHPQAELSSFSLHPIVNNTSASHVFTLPETAPGFTGSNTYAGGYSVRLYADQAFMVRFTKVSTGGSLDLGTATISISGYLIPFDSPTLSP